MISDKTQRPGTTQRKRNQRGSSSTVKRSGQKTPLPSIATALRIWQHSYLIPLSGLNEDLQDRVLILRNHPDVCAMSHNQNIISYAAHQDYLRELQRRQPKFDSCALYCAAVRLIKQDVASEVETGVNSGQQRDSLGTADAKVQDADSNLKILRPIVGVVNVDMRMPDRPLLGLYKNLYHYPHMKLGRVLLFAAMLRASQLGLREVFLECYSQNMPMQKLARQLGFMPQSDAERIRQGGLVQSEAEKKRGELLSYQRYLPSSKNLLQDPMFADFAELKRESESLQLTGPTSRQR